MTHSSEKLGANISTRITVRERGGEERERGSERSPHVRITF